ncbi:Glutathione transport system permease protein GsiD [Hartmannibacter diazotrophicus]|uniref:Glutathione transport system permease protein GsiD n=1 Tax=Hartmannibacter diazotrophicus TaxID=1482074 RepID=A0A2C9DE60_9HYPH|nr:ABC transporter permease [Hartmannibacter diazotrophicus]SON58091.1 Glutathione transport system permease protein GsiD [Hartmannibacter diazotrophicus]
MASTVDAADVVEPVNAAPGYWSGVLKRFLRDPVAVTCTVIVLALILAAIFAPYLDLADPYKGSMIKRLKPIGTPGYLLGADEQGRDMLARLIYGGRLTLFIGLMPVVFAFFIGSALGIFAGYVGGIVNTVIMRTVDVFFAFPSVLLAIAISGALGAGITNTLVSLTVVFVPPLARVAESVTASVRSLDYIDAARASGGGALTIVRVHILGNVLGPIFVYATSLTSVSMILAAGLSFLGIGVSPPEPEWGLMLNTLRTAIYVNPLVAALPGLMIFVTSLCLNLLSDGLRSAMNVRD